MARTESVAFYDEYKPFRNYIRAFGLVPGLVDVWRYSLHITEGQPLPDDYAKGKNALTLKPLREHLYPWELDTLARELVLNAGKGGKRSLKRWNDLAKATNHIRRLDVAAYARGGGEQVDINFELHRKAHRQFPWQANMGVGAMMRAFKVFDETAVEAIVVRELGMTTQQFLRFGAAMNGNFLKSWGMSTNQDYGVLGISREASDAFFGRITCTLEQLRAERTLRQSYDRDWLYARNPLEGTPLVRFDPASPDQVLCPIPRFLTRRVSSGIYYDLVNSAGFDNAFGSSFQAYVGEVITATCPPPRFAALAEDPYYVGTQKMHGADWILSDHTGHLFIESKTKRLPVDAKTLSDTVALNKNLAVMAKAIVQHYRNIGDALDGKTRWVPDALRVYPLVLTLEDWFIFSPRVDEMLRTHVCRLLAEKGIPERVTEEMPYTIASAHEFEIASQVIAQVGISSFMDRKTAPAHQRWLLGPFVAEEFGKELQYVNRHLFADEWARLCPNLPTDETC